MKFCWHDWEPIEYIERFYVKKVCLKCGKKVDTITPRKKEIEIEDREREQRKDKALKIWRGKI